MSNSERAGFSPLCSEALSIDDRPFVLCAGADKNRAGQRNAARYRTGSRTNQNSSEMRENVAPKIAPKDLEFPFFNIEVRLLSESS